VCDLGSICYQLQHIIDENPDTPLAYKIEDTLAKLQTAQDELDKTPPDNQAALEYIECAVGQIEEAVNGGLLDITEGILLMDNLTCIARQLAVDAINEAEADPSSKQDKIYDAQSYLNEGDTLRELGQLGHIDKFRDAVDKYNDAVDKCKDALSEAESAFP